MHKKPLFLLLHIALKTIKNNNLVSLKHGKGISLPTAEDVTKTLGGTAASAIFEANVCVVSMRLCLNSCKKVSFHLLKRKGSQ